MPVQGDVGSAGYTAPGSPTDALETRDAGWNTGSGGTGIPVEVQTVSHSRRRTGDGAVHVVTPGTAVALYTPPSATTLNGATSADASSIVVTSATGFEAGRVISIDTAGNQEGRIIDSVAGTTINLVTPLRIAHSNAVSVSLTGHIEQVIVQAREDNSGKVLVGGPGVIASLGSGRGSDTRRGFALGPGDWREIWVDDLTKVFIDAVNALDGVNYQYEV